MYLSAETNKKCLQSKFLEKNCFGNIEFGVDCNVSVQRIDFFVILFIEDAIKCVTNFFKLDVTIEIKIKGNMPLCCVCLAAKLYKEFEKIQ